MVRTDRIRYGIIGMGLMGIEHMRNILCLDDAVITCIADNYDDSIKSSMEILRSLDVEMATNIRVFTDYEALFRARLCDIAVISTPNFTHYAVLMSAYELADPTMHVLVEKPLCTTLSDCREVLATASKRVGHTFVGLEYSYMPPVARVIRDTRARVVGNVRMVAMREHRFPFLRKVRDWNRFNINSGGTFVEKCCHFFDLFNRIMAPHIPISVFASGAQDVNHLNEKYDGRMPDIFDNGFVIVQYAQGGRACLDLCMFAEASNAQEELSIVGEKGKLEAFLPQLEVRTGIRGVHSCNDVNIEVVDDDRILYRGHHYGSSFLEHLDILKHVQKVKVSGTLSGIKEPPTAGLYQGMLSVAIGVAAHMSVEEGRIVQMKELLEDQELVLCTYN